MKILNFEIDFSGVKNKQDIIRMLVTLFRMPDSLTKSGNNQQRAF
jgi:hypothetical protein